MTPGRMIAIIVSRELSTIPACRWFWQIWIFRWNSLIPRDRTANTHTFQTGSLKTYTGDTRVEAAKAALGKDALWTVELRWFLDLGHTYLSQNGYIRNKTEQYAHETEYSPGDKYLKIRQYQDAQDPFQETKWKHRLSKGESIAVGMIRGTKGHLRCS